MKFVDENSTLEDLEKLFQRFGTPTIRGLGTGFETKTPGDIAVFGRTLWESVNGWASRLEEKDDIFSVTLSNPRLIP